MMDKLSTAAVLMVSGLVMMLIGIIGMAQFGSYSASGAFYELTATGLSLLWIGVLAYIISALVKSLSQSPLK